MRLGLSFSLAALTVSQLAGAQKPAAASTPQLSPRAAYEEAMHPLDATRHSIGNWSDAEVQALSVTIQQAAAACAARDPKSFSGAPLIDYARLCALGQAWPTVIQAASLYIAADAPAKPLLIQAYAARLDAALHLKDGPSALADGKSMLAALPYDGLASEVIDEAIEYMQFTATGDALTLAIAREPLLLERLRSATKPPAAPTAAPALETTLVQPAPPAFVLAPIPSAHELYVQGLALAALQQLTKQPASATATVTALDSALPPDLTADDILPIAASRRRYALLGQPLPQIAATANLSMPDRFPTLPAFQAITALLLFPDWCAQCIRLGSQFPPSVFDVAGHEAYLFALLAETAPARMPVPPVEGVPAKPTPRQALRDTPTLIVPAAVLDQFAATDFPFLVIADSHGIVRVLQPVDEGALQPGGTLDSAIARVGDLWPTTPPKPPAPAPAQ